MRPECMRNISCAWYDRLPGCYVRNGSSYKTGSLNMFWSSIFRFLIVVRYPIVVHVWQISLYWYQSLRSIRMRYNDNEPQWETEKSQNQNMPTKRSYTCSVFDELSADRQPWISAFDRRQARQKRSSIRSFRGHVLLSLWFIIIVRHPGAPETCFSATLGSIFVCSEDEWYEDRSHRCNNEL